MNYKPHSVCRICSNDKLVLYLDLGYLPLSNNLAVSTLDPIHDQRYPLQVLFCNQCGLSQLSIVIPPEEMFSHYLYRSSISQGYKDHCHQMAVDLQQKHNLNVNSFHIDIAGNDGALLQQFKNFLGHKILNIDPALNLAGICEAAGIPILSFFWSMQTAKKIVNSQGQADLITATNVIAHVDNIKEFIEAAAYCLKPSGVLVLEFPYLLDMIEGNDFCQIYYEHLSYLSIYPLTLLCQAEGLEVLSVSRQDIHGGSVRVTVGRGMPDKTVSEFVKAERSGYSTIEPYREFAEGVRLAITNFRAWMMARPGNVAGFAASAKGSTLLNCAGITVGSMRFIVDQTPEKIGKYSPGTRIPIVSMDDMMRTPPDYLALLAWNWKDELMAKARKAGYRGRFVIPLPELKVII